MGDDRHQAGGDVAGRDQPPDQQLAQQHARRQRRHEGGEESQDGGISLYELKNRSMKPGRENGFVSQNGFFSRPRKWLCLEIWPIFSHTPPSMSPPVHGW